MRIGGWLIRQGPTLHHPRTGDQPAFSRPVERLQGSASRVRMGSPNARSSAHYSDYVTNTNTRGNVLGRANQRPRPANAECAFRRGAGAFAQLSTVDTYQYVESYETIIEDQPCVKTASTCQCRQAGEVVMRDAKNALHQSPSTNCRRANGRKQFRQFPDPRPPRQPWVRTPPRPPF